MTDQCDTEIFKNGQSICTFSASTAITEPWVQKVATTSGQRVDWHFSGGRVNVLYLGDRAKVAAAVLALKDELLASPPDERYSGVEAFAIFDAGASGPYRAGTDQPQATVREIDGQLVLEDPQAIAVIKAVGRHNCVATFEANRERVAHFAKRAEERRNAIPLVMVLLNVDDPLGGAIAELLMPGNARAWQGFRDAGQVPFARGLAGREGMQELIDSEAPEVAGKLREITDVLPVIVMDHGAVEVFRAEP